MTNEEYKTLSVGDLVTINEEFILLINRREDFSDDFRNLKNHILEVKSIDTDYGFDCFFQPVGLFDKPAYLLNAKLIKFYIQH